MAALTHTTAIVVVPPRESWAVIQPIRQKHDRKARRWMPHITLIYPFLSEDDFPALHVPLKAAVSRLPGFDVTLVEFKTFRHRRENYTVWLQPEPPEPLVELQAALLKASSGQSNPSSGKRFQPHLSVGQVQGKERMNCLVEELQAAWQPMTFRVDRVSFIWRRDPPDDVFRIADEFLLK